MEIAYPKFKGPFRECDLLPVCAFLNISSEFIKQDGTVIRGLDMPTPLGDNSNIA